MPYTLRRLKEWKNLKFVIGNIIKERLNNFMLWKLFKKDSGDRDKLERIIDKHNHKLEVIRTVCSFIAAVTSALVFLRIFEII